MITIIGGGVLGLTIGWYLAQANRQVTIVEQRRIGTGATQAAAGMMMPWRLSENFSPDLFALQRQSHDLWPDFAKTLHHQTNIDIQYKADGRYFVALEDRALERTQRRYDYHRALDFPLEWLSGDEARRRVPQLGPKIRAAIFSPWGHQVDNRSLTLALQQAFLQAGGVIREETPVSKIVITNDQVQGVQLEQEMLPAETVVVAAGAWSGGIKGVPRYLTSAIYPIKGQTITLQMSPDNPLIDCSILGPVYLTPRQDGRLIIGSTVERRAGFDTQSTAGGVARMLSKAQAIIPAVKDLPLIEMGAGLRPTTADRTPILGPTSVPGLVMATGSYSYGILLSVAIAQGISRHILTGGTPETIEPFLP
ncbi:MAG: glycine oxidase ThiO [Chloroflexota bacterium]